MSCSEVKSQPVMQETKFDPGIGKIPWRRKWQPTPVSLPGKFHGQRSLAGYSPWGHKESDTNEQLHFHCSLLSNKLHVQISPGPLHITVMGRDQRNSTGKSYALATSVIVSNKVLCL